VRIINNLVSGMTNGEHTYFIDKLNALRNQMINTRTPNTSSVITNSVPSHTVTSDTNTPDAGPFIETDLPGPSNASKEINQNLENGSSYNAQSELQLLEGVKLPTKIVSVGRPKGSGLTVIGTKRKSLNSNTQTSTVKRKKFIELSDDEKWIKLLGWLTNVNKNEILSQKISTHKLIEDPRMFNRLGNDEVQLNIIKRLVHTKCFKYLKREVEKLQNSEYWLCAKCLRNLEGLQVKCNGCLDWFHRSATQFFLANYCMI
jgi:hypothetical protein